MTVYSDQSKEYLSKILTVLQNGERAIDVTPTITTSAGAYTAGDNVGGLLLLLEPIKGLNKNTILKSIHVKDNANQKQPLTILLFNSNPTTGATITDNAAFAYGTTSFPKQIAKINILAADYETIDSKATADIDTYAKVLQSNDSSSLWAVVITTGTPTYAANATTLYITFGFLRD